jgi:hypothetical protein
LIIKHQNSISQMGGVHFPYTGNNRKSPFLSSSRLQK